MLTQGPAAALVALLLGVSWAIVYVAGGASTIPPHFPYVPIFLAGNRFGIWGAAVTAVLAGVIHGPLLPADVSAGQAQPFSDWAVRLGFFVAIGVFIAVVLGRARANAERALESAHREQLLLQRESTFLQTAAHEIRTPLTVIAGVARTLERPGMVDEHGAPLLESLSRAVQRLERMSAISLASVGSIEDVRGPPGHVDLREMALAIGREMEDLRGSNRLVVETPEDARTVWTYPLALRPALTALIDNALRFSPRSSPVEVTIGPVETRVRVIVRDFGDGFEPGFVDRAADPFTQGDATLRREQQGLGLGLFAARRLIEQLGGSLTLANHARGGAETVVELPGGEDPAKR